MDGEWIPPEPADPKAILREAYRDAKSGRWQIALAKHIWFHRNAVQLRPSVACVRSSFALWHWARLGKVYPPALVALRAERDRVLVDIETGDWSPEAFWDLASINRCLEDSAATIRIFERLHTVDPARAMTAVGSVREDLIKAGRPDLVGPYLNAEFLLCELLRIVNQLADPSSKRDPQFARWHLDDIAERLRTTIAVMMKLGREAEAKRTAAAATAYWPDADFLSRFEAALR